MIVLITGLMASGKSTIAELLAKRFARGVHLRGDIFRKMIVSGREDMGEHATVEAVSQLHLRYRLTAQAAKEYHAAGFTVVVQDNYYGDELPYMLELLAPETAQIIALCPNIATIKHREQQRDKTGYSSFDVEQLYHAFMNETPRIGLWVDSSGQTPEQTVEEIVARLGI